MTWRLSEIVFPDNISIITLYLLNGYVCLPKDGIWAIQDKVSL